MSWQKHPDKAPECEMNSSTKRLCVCVHVCFKVRVCVCMCALRCVCVWVMHMCDVSVWERKKEREVAKRWFFFVVKSPLLPRPRDCIIHPTLWGRIEEERERESVCVYVCVCVCVCVRERERERRGVFPGLNFLFIFSIMPKFFFLILFSRLTPPTKKITNIFFVLVIYFFVFVCPPMSFAQTGIEPRTPRWQGMASARPRPESWYLLWKNVILWDNQFS